MGILMGFADLSASLFFFFFVFYWNMSRNASVVADSVGDRFLSGFGGQVDFIRGAAIGNDGLGKPIIAITSITKKGQSKIVPYINKVSIIS